MSSKRFMSTAVLPLLIEVMTSVWRRVRRRVRKEGTKPAPPESLANESHKATATVLASSDKKQRRANWNTPDSVGNYGFDIYEDGDEGFDARGRHAGSFMHSCLKVTFFVLCCGKWIQAYKS